MAIRARLAAPPRTERAVPTQLAPRWTIVPAHLLWRGDRRMEAETYLASGYGVRTQLEDRPSGWSRLANIAQVWQPSRLKGIQVGAEFGTPFLSATQAFEFRPAPRKWLALERTDNAPSRFVTEGTILVTRSGTVGRTTLAYSAHAGTLISDDLLRVTAKDDRLWGWLYAYFHSPQARAMMVGAHYGHIIKHLEVAHLNALPVPIVRDDIAADFWKRARAILELRDRAYRLAVEAEQRFEQAIGAINVPNRGETGFVVHASAFFTRRRRLEATPHNPAVATIRRHLEKHGKGLVRLHESGFDVWLPTRFRRVPAEDGTLFLDSADLFETNPDLTKRIANVDFGDPYAGRVRPVWLLVARSGQTYGINGSATISTAALADKIISDHVIRVAPRAEAKMRTGYLHVALSHPNLGRPVVKSLAYGSSIPEIDPSDLASIAIVRLTKNQENAIADLAEDSAAARAEADVLERELAADAGKLIERFLAGDTLPFVTISVPRTKSVPPAALPEHSLVRLRRAFGEEGLRAGAVGTIVHIYDASKGYEVEFESTDGSVRVLTLQRDDLEIQNAA
jgi:Domain of unknown function (DUF4926)